MAVIAFKYTFKEKEKNPPISPLPSAKLKYISEHLNLKRWLCLRFPEHCIIFTARAEIADPLQLWDSLQSQKLVPNSSPENSQLLTNGEALRLFFEIATGIANHTNTLNFTEILHESYSQALELSFVGPELHHLFNRSIWLNEKIRLKTSYFKLAVNQNSVVWELAEKIFGNLDHTALSIIGHNDILIEILTEFKQKGLTKVFIHDKVRMPSKRTQNLISTLEINIDTHTESFPVEADILLVFSMENYSFTNLREQIVRRLAQKSNFPLVIVDWSNHPKLKLFSEENSNIFYYNKDDIHQVIEHNQKEQVNEINIIKDWIKGEVTDFYQWLENDRHYQFINMVGISPKMQLIFETISRIAQTDITVLINGESGTGKELVAKAIHKLGNRSNNPFLVVNCGAIPENLIESELFGHVKGAFTGAIAPKHGLFETANHGTIFLDEIAELPILLQVKLLRFLQDGEIKKVGSNDTIKLDVRVLSATNRNLSKSLKEGNFRSDLYYRLNVIQLNLPSLRDRKEDIPLLIQHFLKKFNQKFQKQVNNISQNVRDLLLSYSWPGNVRELENAIERAVALTVGNMISLYDLPPHLLSFQEEAAEESFQKHPTLKEIEKEHILETLEICEWNYEEASKLLGISRTTLWRKLKEYNLDDTGN
jgi:transcriptional regulator with PAS, ATPase and Fis domain